MIIAIIGIICSMLGSWGVANREIATERANNASEHKELATLSAHRNEVVLARLDSVSLNVTEIGRRREVQLSALADANHAQDERISRLEEALKAVIEIKVDMAAIKEGISDIRRQLAQRGIGQAPTGSTSPAVKGPDHIIGRNGRIIQLQTASSPPTATARVP